MVKGKVVGCIEMGQGRGGAHTLAQFAHGLK